MGGAGRSNLSFLSKTDKKRKSRSKVKVILERYILNTENTDQMIYFLWKTKKNQPKLISLQDFFPGGINIRYKRVVFIELLRSEHCYAKLPTTMKPILNTI